MLNFKALSLAIAMLIPTTMSNVYSFRQGKFCNHHFLELDKSDAIFDLKFDNYSRLPTFGVTYLERVPELKQYEREYLTENNDKLVISSSDNKNYSVWYLVKFSENKEHCRINCIKGLCDQLSIEDVSEVDPIIFVYPFIYNDNLKSLCMDFINFSEQYKNKLVEIGFKEDRGPHGRRTGTLTMDRDGFLKCRENVIYGGRT